MIRILFLLVLFNCNKMSLRNLENIDKCPINSKLMSAIKKASDDVIDKEIINLKRQGHIKDLIELRDGNKNFLMVLLQNYGIDYNFEGDIKDNAEDKSKEKDLIKGKKDIFEKYLPEFKNKINDSDSEGKTVLFYAIDTGIGEIVTAVLDMSNVDVEQSDVKGISPLNHCILNRSDIFEYLNKNKIKDKNSKDTRLNYLTKFTLSKNKKLAGTSPLILACTSNKAEVVKILLENGAEVNMENENDTKAIWLAAKNGNEEIVSELLARGAKHLTQKGIILEKVKTVMGILMKVLLQKSIDAAIFVAGRAPGIGIPGIPLGVDLNPIFEKFQHVDEVNKNACYKEVRRIYKSGYWVTHFTKDELDENVIIEIASLLSDILSVINKKYSKLSGLYEEMYRKEKNSENLRKMFVIKKFDQEKFNDTETVDHYLDKVCDHIMSLYNFPDKLNLSGQEFKDLNKKVAEIKRSKIKQSRYYNYKKVVCDTLSKEKDKIFEAYLNSEGEIKSFYKLGEIFNETIDAFQLLIGKEKYGEILNYLRKNFQRRERVKKSLIKFFEKRKKANELLKSFKEKLEKIPKAEKVSKIDDLSEEKIVIASKTKKVSSLEVDDESQLEIPKIVIRPESFDGFISKYKELLIERDKLFKFIERNIN